MPTEHGWLIPRYRPVDKASTMHLPVVAQPQSAAEQASTMHLPVVALPNRSVDPLATGPIPQVIAAEATMVLPVAHVAPTTAILPAVKAEPTTAILPTNANAATTLRSFKQAPTHRPLPNKNANRTTLRPVPAHYCFQCGQPVPPWREDCPWHDLRQGRGLPPPVRLIPWDAGLSRAPTLPLLAISAA